MVSSIRSIINPTFLGRLNTSDPAGGASSASSSSTPSSYVGGNLRVGATRMSRVVEGLNTTITAINFTQSTLEDLRKITKEVIQLSDIAAKDGTSSSQRSNLDGRFRKLAARFEKKLEDSQIEDIDVATVEGLTDLFQRVGLDPQASADLAGVFKRFTTPKLDDAFASEYEKGKRPLRKTIQEVTQTVSTTVGTGTFQPRLSLATTIAERVVTVGYFDNDANLDFIATSESGNGANIFKGNGNGTFQARETIIVGGTAAGNTLADFDQNGFGDIAAVNYTTAAQVGVYLQNSDGTFAARDSLATGTSPTRVQSYDFNNDGFLDLLSNADGGTTLNVHINQGDGTFGARITLDAIISPHVMAIGDVTGNGIIDLVSASDTGDRISIIKDVVYNAGSFTTGATITIATGNEPNSIQIGDVNGDALNDIVTGDFNGGLAGTASIFYSQGGGAFAARVTVAVGDGPSDLLLTDLDGDNKLDIATANRPDDQIGILFGNGNGTFESRVTLSAGNGPNFMAFGDFNNDGVDDLVSTNNNEAIIDVFIQNTTTANVSTTTFEPGIIPREYTTIFSSRRTLTRQGDAIGLASDARALLEQIDKNLDALEDARDLVGKNIDLARSVGLGLLDLSQELVNSTDAEDVAAMLRNKIKQRGAASLTQASNLDPLLSAELARESAGGE